MTIKEKISQLFVEHEELTVKEITEILNVSKQMVHISLNRLLTDGHVEKFGRTPKTFYRRRVQKKQTPITVDIAPTDEDFLEKHFILITEIGEIKTGLEGFSLWCTQRNLPIQKTIGEYISTRKKYLE